MTADQLQTIVATLRGVGGGGAAGTAGAANMFEATREGEVAAPAHTYGRVEESTEQSLPKQVQVRPGTREGEVAVQAHTCERGVESTEPTQLGLDTEATREVEMNKIRLKLDRMWPGTREWEVAMQAYTYEQDIAGYLSPLLQFYPCPGEKLDYVICLWRTHLL